MSEIDLILFIFLCGLAVLGVCIIFYGLCIFLDILDVLKEGYCEGKQHRTDGENDVNKEDEMCFGT